MTSPTNLTQSALSLSNRTDTGRLNKAWEQFGNNLPKSYLAESEYQTIITKVCTPFRGTKGMGYIGKYRHKDVPEAVGDYPEFHMFGELPAWAFYVRHVDGLNLRNVTVRKRAEDYRDAVILDDVKGVNGHIEIVTIDAD